MQPPFFGKTVNVAGLSAHKASLATARLKLNVFFQIAPDKLTKAKRPGVRGLQGVDRHEEITNGNANQTVRGEKVASILPPSRPPFASVSRSNETSAGFLLNYLSNGGRERHLITQPQI